MSSVDSICHQRKTHAGFCVYGDTLNIWMPFGLEGDLKVLPSVLHLNAVTVRAPATLFSTTSQSPSTA